jgi:hypothetical protein
MPAITYGDLRSASVFSHVTACDRGLMWTPLVGQAIGLNKVVGLAARKTPRKSCAAAAAV